MSFPALFISHGAPTILIDPNLPGQALKQLGDRLRQPHPEAILIISAHWGTEMVTVSNAAQPETIHDFYGFPAELYKLRYAAPGAPTLAAEVVQRLSSAGISAMQQSHGLDHGAWIPLNLMFPDADIPVLQLSVQPHLDPSHHWQIGAALAPLRERILIIGSGQMTHNLGALNRAGGTSTKWAKEFADWMQQRIELNDRDALLDYRRQAPHAVKAHPTDEHLLPLFTALGAAGTQFESEHLDWGISYGTLAWDSYILQ